jgi:uncharacterized protein (TIGR03000 family)
MMVAPAGVAPAPAPAPEPKKEATGPTPATIVVTLPPGAKLSIDDTPTQATGPQRTFATPALSPGQVYHYTLKADLDRNGQTVSTSQRINVQAGQETRVTLNLPVASVAAR